MNSMWPRPILVGILFVLIGTLTWLYGDFGPGGDTAHIWGGVAIILLGTAIWAYKDWSLGLYNEKKHRKRSRNA